jgi:TonB family protein
VVSVKIQTSNSRLASKGSEDLMRLALLVLVLASAFGVTTIAQQEVYDAGNGVTLPVVVKEVKPSYTKGAMERQIQGSVLLKSVVLADGTVGDVEVLRSLDSELDQQAIDALKQWEFKPGTREGKPVAVRIACELTFTLK